MLFDHHFLLCMRLDLSNIPSPQFYMLVKLNILNSICSFVPNVNIILVASARVIYKHQNDFIPLHRVHCGAKKDTFIETGIRGKGF